MNGKCLDFFDGEVSNVSSSISRWNEAKVTIGTQKILDVFWGREILKFSLITEYTYQAWGDKDVQKSTQNSM